MTPPRFLTPLRTETIGPGRWILTDDLVFESARYPGKFIAPRGMQTDLASIPRICWTILPKVGKHDKAAVIHDGGYAGALVTERGDRIWCVKHVADHLFDEGMRAEGVNGFARRSMYRAVVLFGSPAAHPLAVHRTRLEVAIRMKGFQVESPDVVARSVPPLPPIATVQVEGNGPRLFA